MKRAACALLLALGACVTHGVERTGSGPDAANRDPTDWANLSANAMVEKYGPPDRVETRRMVWEDRGPWKRIAVWDELGFGDSLRSSNNIESAISYAVPQSKLEDLAAFSPGLLVSSNNGEIAVRSRSESRNFLMLNLADDVISGRSTPEQARMTYLRTLRLAESGKSSPAMERLLFR